MQKNVIRLAVLLIFLLGVTACQQHKNQSEMAINQKNNPLKCDIKTGVCETTPFEKPLALKNQNKEVPMPSKSIRIVYFTDPICSSCWGIEPQLRKLKMEYGHVFNIEYRMGGLLPDWSYNSGGISKPSDVATHWDEASHYYSMPIDGDVWLEDPLDSSYPSSIAFKAAELQGEDLAQVYLRTIREMVFLKKINIAKEKVLIQAAKEVGLDIKKFEEDMKGQGKINFEKDLEFARNLGVRGFPTVIFYNDKNDREVIYGYRSYDIFEGAIKKLYPAAKRKDVDVSWETLFAKYPTLTTKEFSVLSQISFDAAKKQLIQLLSQEKIQRLESRNGSLWILK